MDAGSRDDESRGSGKRDHLITSGRGNVLCYLGRGSGRIRAGNCHADPSIQAALTRCSAPDGDEVTASNFLRDPFGGAGGDPAAGQVAAQFRPQGQAAQLRAKAAEDQHGAAAMADHCGTPSSAGSATT